MSYVFSQGLRLVVPYLDRHRIRVKAAWVGREVQQVRSLPMCLAVFCVRVFWGIVYFVHAVSYLKWGPIDGINVFGNPHVRTY